MVLVKDGLFLDVFWFFGEENCKVRIEILVLRVEENERLEEVLWVNFFKGGFGVVVLFLIFFGRAGLVVEGGVVLKGKSDVVWIVFF